MSSAPYKRLATAVVLCAAVTSSWATPIVLEDFEAVSGVKVTRKPATFEASEDAAVGSGALHVTMPGMVTKTLARSNVPGSAEWDRYQGISFRVKGDGSDQYGCIAVGGQYMFAAYFSLKQTEWRTVTLSWDDLVPERQCDPIGTPGSLPPSGISKIRFGSRWTIYHNNAKIPPYEFWVDQVQLEETVPAPGPAPTPRSFEEVLQLLKTKSPIHVQCMGDSITAGTGLADRDRDRYATGIQNELRHWLGYDGISCVSRAVGGAKLTDARAWVPRDFEGQNPDLVTMWYGYNDKSNTYTRDYFKRSLNDYIDRVCRITNGNAAICLFATGPGCGPRFVMLDDYAEVVREVARERGLGLFDMNRTLKAIGRDKIQDYFGDMAHPNKEGHRLIADAVTEFLVRSAGIDTPKPPPPEKPVVPPGTEHRWDLEDGAKGWELQDDVSCVDTRAASGKHAICFKIVEPAASHRRAYSPPMPVVPGQQYTVGTKILCDSRTDGHFGLYACTYTSADGKGHPTVIRVKPGPDPSNQWRTLEGKIEIPEGAASMRVLLWAAKGTIATFFCDDIAVVPVE